MLIIECLYASKIRKQTINMWGVLKVGILIFEAYK